MTAQAPAAWKVVDGQLWREVRTQWMPLARTVALHAAVSACIIAHAYLLSQVISLVFLSEADYVDTEAALALLLLVVLLRGLLVTLATYSARKLAIDVKRSLRRRLLLHLGQLGPSYIQGERTGELINTVSDGVEALESYFSQYLPQLLVAVLVPLSIVIAVGSGDLLSAAILLATAPLIPLFMALVGHGAQRMAQRQWLGLSYMSAHFFDVLQGLSTLKIMGQSRAQIARVARISRNYGDATLKVLRISFLSALVLELAATLSVAIIAVEIALRLLEGTLAFNTALFILILAPEFYAPLRLLGARFHAGMEGVSASQRIFSVLDTPIPARRQVLERPALPDHPATIRFRGVSFAFEDGERPALRRVTLDIEPGSRIAIVGESGAGKSTLTQLLLGFIEPQEGAILIDDTPLNTIARDSWLEHIAWVPQSPYLLNDTVAANIGMGNEKAGKEELIRAARRAGAHEFITQFPDGYDTVVGEHGVRLSAGQAQRLALARAFLKEPHLLILDEPTANLDPITESLVRDAIRELPDQCTVVTVTHRLNTLNETDHIVVLHDGRIVTQGPPDILFGMNGTVVKERRTIHSPGAMADVNHSQGSALQLTLDCQHSTSSRHAEAVQDALATVSMRAILGQLFDQLRGNWSWITVSVLLGALTVGSSVGLLGTSAYLISMAALRPSIAVLNVPIVAVRFFGLSRGISRYLERLTTHTVTFRLLAKLRTWAFTTLEPLAPARLPTAGSGDLLARIVSDVATLEDFYVRAVAPPMVAVVVLISATLLMLQFHWQLAFLLTLFLAVAGVLLPFFGRVAGRERAQVTVDARAGLHAALVDFFQGLGDLTVYGQVDRVTQQIGHLGASLAYAQLRLGRISAIQEGLHVSVMHLASWSILVLGTLLASRGELNPVYLATLVMIALTSFEATQPLAEASVHLERSLHAAGRLFSLSKQRPAVSEPRYPRPIPEYPNIELRGVTFRYVVNERPALHHIDVKIPYGRRLAIVGFSGAGKSSIANLLLRLWNCDEGQLWLNDHDVAEYATEDVRSLFNLVPQRAHLFNASIADNIRVANPEANLQMVRAATQIAQLHEFVVSLPDGYGTVIGERGLKLSAGQRQRLALARAFVRPAPVLLLDEPTANLDQETERALLNTVFESAAGRTIVYIGHRLALMNTFDEIIVLDRGHIVERGTHHALLASHGLYAELWRLQQTIQPGLKDRSRTGGESLPPDSASHLRDSTSSATALSSARRQRCRYRRHPQRR